MGTFLCNKKYTGPLFTKLRDWFCNVRFALKFDRQFGSATAELPVKFQSDWISLNMNGDASKFQDILR